MKLLMVIIFLTIASNLFAQKKQIKNTVYIIDKVLDRVYFGNLNDMVMYRKQTIDYLISDKSDKTLMTGFIKSNIKINNTLRFIIQNEYMYEISKMNMYFNTPSIGFRKYF